jgi:predicted nucleic acid-binding protein
MRLVVADTSPLVYLVLIDHIDVLPQLFETVLVPEAVHAELRNAAAPAADLGEVPATVGRGETGCQHI